VWGGGAPPPPTPPRISHQHLKATARRSIIQVMSVEAVMARMAELHTALNPRQAPVVAQTASTATVTNPTAFASMLDQTAGLAPTAGPASGGGGAGAQIVALAQQEVGVAEQPPGSNDSPRIAEFRAATDGAPGPGPWCAYFTSWAAKQAGVPLGDHGQGFGRVDDVYAWAQSAGKANPVSSGQPPKPGDHIVWYEHIGVDESVGADGRIQTIEGNSSDQVSRRTYGADGGGALGFVSMS
jgi:hypothetical protein